MALGPINTNYQYHPIDWFSFSKDVVVFKFDERSENM